MAKDKFTEEYDASKKALKTAATAVKGGNSKPDQAYDYLLQQMLLLMADDGPVASHASILESLRRICKSTEAAGVLTFLKDNADKATQAAAIKNLRHLYLMSKFGGVDTWVLSLPKPYKKWTTDEVGALTGDTLYNKLGLIDEYHSETDRKNLQTATQKALAWAMKCKTLCTATDESPLSAGGKTLIKRWFADEDHQSDEEVGKLAKTLATGFGKIAAAISSGKLILTDNPTDRGTSYEQSEAYVFTVPDRLNVIYVEGDFFGTKNTLSGAKNWARIIVHELSHSKLNTKDIKVPGDAHDRYSWHPKGIRPRKASFHTAYAIDNADSWAFFAVDAAGELTSGERNTALKPHIN